MKRAMNNKEVKEILDLLKSDFNLTYTKKDHFDREENVILINNEPMFFYNENKLLPTLKTILKNNFLKKITVDMGAVRFVVSGADIMRPGIVNLEEGIQKEEVISIVDVAHSKPLAIGQALFSGEEIKAMASGKVVKNLHWVGDNIWGYH